MKEPFDQILTSIENNKNRIEAVEKFNPISKELDKLRKVNRFYSFIYYWSKPLITCITCMASFWGVVVFVGLNDVGFIKNIDFVFLNCVSASFLQTFIYRIYERFL